MINIKDILFILMLICQNSVTMFSQNEQWSYAEKVDQLLNQAMSCYSIQGLGISVVKKDKIVYQKSFGYSDIKNKVPYSVNETNILIASISKSFTAILISYFSIINRFNLDVTINSILPKKSKLEFMTPCRTKMATFEDLLAHRMAVNRHDFALIFDGIEFNELLKKLRFIPPSSDNDFRVKFMYSNIMYVVAEKILEKIVNRSFIQLMNETIFSPLKMKNTFLITNSSGLKNLAKSMLINENIHDDILKTPANILGACGIVTTIQDISKWQLFLTNNQYAQSYATLRRAIDKTKIGKVSLNTNSFSFLNLDINQTTFRKFKLKNFRRHQYALGWFLSQYRDLEVLWHGGSYFGIESILVWVSSLNISIFINVNTQIHFGQKNYQKFIQQIPLIIVDFFLDIVPIYSQIVPKSICHLFNFPINKKGIFKQKSSVNYTYDFVKDIFPIIIGKYSHPAFGEIIIRRFLSEDKSWILNPFKNEMLIMQYGKLFKAMLIKTTPQCKQQNFISNMSDGKKPNLKFYGFFLYKGSPYWFLPPLIIPEEKNLTLIGDTCHVLIQHKIISNEYRLWIRFLEEGIIEFVRKNSYIVTSCKQLIIIIALCVFFILNF